MEHRFLMNFGFKSYNSWDPLKKVLLGSTLPKGFFADFPDSKVADAMTKVNEETREDLNNLQAVFESKGIEVYRMPEACVLANKRYNSVAEFVELNGYIPKPFNAPRDDQIIFGEHMITGTTSPVHRIFHGTKEDTHNIFDEHAPWSGCNDLIDLADPQQELNIFDAVGKPNFTMSWPSIMRAGKDIIIDIHDFNGPTRHLAEAWVDKFNEKFGYDFRINTTTMGGHTDAVMALIKPGLILSHVNVNKYEQTFPGWDIIKIQRAHNDHTSAWNQFRISEKDKWRGSKKRPVADYWIAGEEHNVALNKFIDLYMHPSVGSCFETNFDVNCISIDENTVVASGPSKVLEDKLGEHKVDVITSNMRHRFFWDGGLHCATVDLYREGNMEDYFPERTTGIDFGKVWGNEETRR